MEFDEKLRSWAKGSYTLEAGTELLIRAFGGRFANTGEPWIHVEDGQPWIEFGAIAGNVGALSGGERRMLLIVASIGGGGPVDLSEVLPPLDRANLNLVLAAVSHAGGSQEHSELVENQDGTHSIRRQAALYPWPKRHGVLHSVPPIEN
jgi:hypothetical protein